MFLFQNIRQNSRTSIPCPRIKSSNFLRIMRLAGYDKCMGDTRYACISLIGKLKERDHLENISVRDSVVLNWFLMKNYIRV